MELFAISLHKVMLEKGLFEMRVNLKFINNELFSAHLPTFMTTDNTTDNRFMPAEIVGGQVAPSPIPWQVSVQKGGSHFCGGTILDTYTILSAAHCFDDFGDSVDGFQIRAGSRKWSSGGQVC